ncbi:MFS transporter [Bacillus sp. FJAT-45066]|uniref:MFS transporter n=1 Tax=Bacillus sp. FJAT-45066 TaxID=2011010 RepID=UPI000BB70635|nr:MFS transporter [Bacillus sp. FJAT-45066]
MTALWLNFKRDFNLYNRNIRLFFITNILTQIGLGIFMIMYNFYIRELGYSEQVNGNMIAMTALASAIILIPAGIISDKIGRKKVMVFGLFFSSFFLLFRSTFEGELLLLTCAFLSGLTLAFLQVTAIPWLAENSTNSERVKLFSRHFAVMMIANVVGNLLGGVLTDIFLFFGLTSVSSVRWTLIIGVAIYLGGILPILKMVEKKRETKLKDRISIRNLLTTNKTQLKLIASFTIANILIGFGSGLVIPYLNLYFADRFDTTNTTIGFVLSMGQAVTAVAMIIGPALVRRIGEIKAVVLLQVLSLPFMLITAFTNVFWLAVLGFLFRQALMNAANPIITSMMMERVEDKFKGLANSVNQMVFSLGWASMGPVSMSIVFYFGQYWGYAIVFSITAVLYLTSAVYFYFIFSRKKSINSQRSLLSKIS